MNEMEYRTIGKALAGGYRAAVYCRLSKDDDLQGESASIANQENFSIQENRHRNQPTFIARMILRQNIYLDFRKPWASGITLGDTVTQCLIIYSTKRTPPADRDKRSAWESPTEAAVPCQNAAGSRVFPVDFDRIGEIDGKRPLKWQKAGCPQCFRTCNLGRKRV